MRSLRNSAPRSGTDLFDANWAILTAAVLAAHRNDRDRYLAQIVRFETDLPIDLLAETQTALALLWLLNRRIGTRPTSHAVSELAWTIQSRVTAMAGTDHGSVGALVDAMLFVYEQRSGAEIGGARFLFTGIAAIGALLQDPDTELADARRSAERWVAKHEFPSHDGSGRAGLEERRV